MRCFIVLLTQRISQKQKHSQHGPQPPRDHIPDPPVDHRRRRVHRRGRRVVVVIVRQE